MRKAILVALAWFGAGLACLAADADRVSFNRDIRPIMSDTCFRCHGPDKSSRMANLRLDLRVEATKPLKDGRIPIVPGDTERSAIIQRIFAATPAKRMPPPYAHKNLTESQKETFRRWVAQGAVYEGHWAYEAVKRSAVPDLGPHAPIENPVDSFIQERLLRAGLTPAPEADRRTLIRRVTFDLTGLPPTPEEVAAFEQDHSAEAYTKVVDRLLDSPRYAEQRTMRWLDAVRYADTCGFHGDNIFPAWPYRDYVLRSFRDNRPFDEFTREQLAGDLIPNATLEQKIASAYNRLNRTSAEGGLQPKEYLAKYGADRVRSVSIAWLGSTMGCAECHDHKFDPFLAKDFYAMKAFFADVEETGFMPDRGAKAWGTQVDLPTPEQARLRDFLARQIELAQKNLEEQRTLSPATTPDDERHLLLEWQKGKLAWHFQHPESAKSANGAKLTIYNDEPVDSLIYVAGPGGASLLPHRAPGNGLVVASGPNPDNETYQVTMHPGSGVWTSLAVNVEQDDSLPGDRISRGADRFLLTGVEAEVFEPGKPGRSLRFSLATSSQPTEPGMPPMAAIDDDPNTGWGIRILDAVSPFLALRFSEPLTTGPESRLVVKLKHESVEYRRAVIGRFRLALSSGRYAWPAEGSAYQRIESKDETGEKSWASGLSTSTATALDSPEEDRSESQTRALRDFLDWARPGQTAARAKLEALQAQSNVLESSITRVVTSVAVAEPQITRILPRGNWMDDSGPVVEPAIPEFLGKLSTGDRRATRLDLANWIASPANPLTARVFVNRLWREFFGTGISKVLDDVGSQGEWPSNPELLDWLASEFVHPEWDAAQAHAWDVKHVVRTIVLSHAYRQSSEPSPEMLERDPENRLVARQSRFRLDAENVHDVALSVSGLLRDRFGGPSVNPYQPDGYLATLNFPKREYSASRGDDLYRRGVYTLWRRTFLHPSLAAFDAPTREECTVNRTISNTPLQALVLLNDPIFVEAARALAERAIANGAALDQRLDWAFLRALNRTPSPAERTILARLYRDNLRRFDSNPKDARALLSVGESPVNKGENPAELAAMTMVTRAVLNLHETITRN